MPSINKVIIIGTLGADPEYHQFNNGGAVANISVATSEQWRDKQTGQKQEQTEWHRIVLANRGHYKMADIAKQYLRKGSQVYIEGGLRTRKYQDQNGQERYITEIRADNMQMLGNRYNDQARKNHLPSKGSIGQSHADVKSGKVTYQPQAFTDNTPPDENIPF